MKGTAANELMVQFARDLSCRTADEIRERWSPRERLALDKIDDLGFDARLQDHNPIYYLAERVFFDNDPSLLWPPFHRDRIAKAFLEHELDDSGEYAGLVILAQRDSFKSTFAHGVVPLFAALRAREVYGYDERIALIHHKEDQASASLQRLKAKLVQDERQPNWLGRVWPEFTAGEEFGTKTVFDWPCRKKGAFHEPSVLAAGMGARLTGYHFGRIYFDDIVTEDHRVSSAIREEAFFRYQASRFMLDTLKGKESCTGTRYHVNDLWSKLLKADAGGTALYKRVVIQALDDETEELSLPNRHTYIFLERKRQEEISRSGNDHLWHLQYQNEPKTSGMIATEKQWIRYCKLAEIPASAWRILLVDPAWKGSKNHGEGCNAALAVLGMERRGAHIFRYLMDLTISNEMTGRDGVQEIFRLMKKWKVRDVIIEEIGGHSFRTEVENEGRKRGMFVNLIDPKTKNQHKNDRIVVLLGQIQAGVFYIAKECPNQEEFVSEFEDFPESERKDALDAVAYSCDPAVAGWFSPQLQENDEEWPIVGPPEPMRTRHCAF